MEHFATRLDLVEILRKDVERAGSQAELARQWRVPQASLSHAVNGRFRPVILAKMGFRRLELYEAGATPTQARPTRGNK